MRIRFEKGKQRDFLKKVLEKANCPSLRELINRGIDVNYSTLKNYYNEDRLISEEVFNELVVFGNMNKEELIFELVEEHWGQSKGGRISKRD